MTISVFYTDLRFSETWNSALWSSLGTIHFGMFVFWVQCWTLVLIPFKPFCIRSTSAYARRGMLPCVPSLLRPCAKGMAKEPEADDGRSVLWLRTRGLWPPEDLKLPQVSQVLATAAHGGIGAFILLYLRAIDRHWGKVAHKIETFLPVLECTWYLSYSGCHVKLNTIKALAFVSCEKYPDQNESES